MKQPQAARIEQRCTFPVGRTRIAVLGFKPKSAFVGQGFLSKNKGLEKMSDIVGVKEKKCSEKNRLNLFLFQ